MRFFCLCKLPQVFSIVLVLNRSPPGSTYQLFLVQVFISVFPLLSPSPLHPLLLTQDCFIWHRLLIPSEEDFFIPCLPLLSSCSFTCHPTISQFTSPPHFFQVTPSPSVMFLTSSPRLIVSSLPAHPTSSSIFQQFSFPV